MGRNAKPKRPGRHERTLYGSPALGRDDRRRKKEARQTRSKTSRHSKEQDVTATMQEQCIVVSMERGEDAGAFRARHSSVLAANS